MKIIAGKKALQSSAFTSAELHDGTLPGSHLVIQLHSQFLSCAMFYDFCSLTLSQSSLHFVNVCPGSVRTFVEPRHARAGGPACGVVSQRSAMDGPSAHPELLSGKKKKKVRFEIASIPCSKPMLSQCRLIRSSDPHSYHLEDNW